MTREILNFVSPRAEAEFYARNGLASHVRQLRRRSRDMSRWLALAVVTGSVVALAIIRFLSR